MSTLSTLLLSKTMPKCVFTTSSGQSSIAKKKGQILFCTDTGQLHFDSSTSSRVNVTVDLSNYTSTNNILLKTTGSNKTIKFQTNGTTVTIDQGGDVTIDGVVYATSLVTEYSLNVGTTLNVQNRDIVRWEKVTGLNQNDFSNSDTFGKYMELSDTWDIELYDDNGFKVDASLRYVETEIEGMSVTNTRVYIPSDLASNTISGWYYIKKAKFIYVNEA